MAERSKALRSGRSPLLWAWVRIPLLTKIFFSFSDLGLVAPAMVGSYLWAVSVVVITSALHAEGRQFEPGTDQILVCKAFAFAALFVVFLGPIT